MGKFSGSVLLLLVWGAAACGGTSGGDKEVAIPEGDVVVPTDLAETTVVDLVPGLEVADVSMPDVADVSTPDKVDISTMDVADVSSADIPDVSTADIPDVSTADTLDVSAADTADAWTADTFDLSAADTAEFWSADVAEVKPEVFDVAAEEVWVEPQTAWEALESLVDDHLLGELPPAISAAAVYGNQQQDAGFYYIIDVRPGGAFSSGHIPGAVNVPLGQIKAHAEGGSIPADKPVLVVCMAGQQSGWAVALLRLEGYDAYSLRWGMPAWSTAGGNMWAGGCSNQAAGVKESAPNEMGEEQPFPDFEGDPEDAEALLAQRVSAVWSGGFKLKTYGSVKESLDSYYIVAHLDEAQYLAGHLPGAVHFQPGIDFDDEAGLAYLPTGKSILVYDCTGESSAAVAVHLNVLGYQAYTLKFGANSLWYDALTDCKWSAGLVEDFPVETQ